MKKLLIKLTIKLIDKRIKVAGMLLNTETETTLNYKFYKDMLNSYKDTQMFLYTEMENK